MLFCSSGSKVRIKRLQVRDVRLSSVRALFSEAKGRSVRLLACPLSACPLSSGRESPVKRSAFCGLRPAVDNSA